MKRNISLAKQHQTARLNLIERLHPSLRAQFIPLPKAGETLTDEQLSAIFSGDLSALRDVIQLVRPQVRDNTEQ